MIEPSLQCTAHNRLGVQCARAAMEGSVVCRYHGGGAPMARAAAKKRLLALVPDAIEALKEAMDRGDWNHVVRSSLGILDRAGFGPMQTVKVEDDRDNLRELTDEELVARTQQVLLLIKQKGITHPATTNDEGTSETPAPPDIVH